MKANNSYIAPEMRIHNLKLQACMQAATVIPQKETGNEDVDCAKSSSFSLEMEDDANSTDWQ